jgi:hypothetical protein
MGKESRKCRQTSETLEISSQGIRARGMKENLLGTTKLVSKEALDFPIPSGALITQFPVFVLLIFKIAKKPFTLKRGAI